MRRRACVLAALAATAAFGLAPGGRAVAQVDPTPSSLDTCAPTDGSPTPTPSPTEPSPTPEPSPTDPTPAPTPEPSPTDPTPAPTPNPTPTPEPSPTEPSPTPEPSPTEPCPTSDPSPTDTSPTPAPRLLPASSTAPPTPTEPPDSTPTIPAPGEQWPSPPASQPSPAPIATRSAHERAFTKQAEQVTTSIGGTYSTAALDDVYDKLVKAGMSKEVATRRVYRPFIVQGPAAWTDSWHAPRYAGGFHLHEGQDVLCRFGAPVLAATPGRIEFGVDVLGGRIARLFLPDGGYWYYAHLSDWNSTIESGSLVEVGEVIGYCGNSGDAIGGAPHVHFGHYLASGEAENAMSDLVGWLEAAERRAGVTERAADAARSPTVVATYTHELGAEPTVIASSPVSSPVVTAGLSTARPSAAPTSTDMLALAVAVAARLLLIPGRRVARRLGSLAGRGTG